MNLLTPDHEKVKARAYSEGVRDTHARVIKAFTQWAMTHPDQVVRDELWGFVEKLRRMG